MKNKLLTVGLTSILLLTGFSTASAEENTSPETYTLTQQEEEQFLKEQREELREIWDKYIVETPTTVEIPTTVETPTIEPFAVERPPGSIGGKGDILIALDSITDHVGIVKDSYSIIEAHPDTGNVSYRDNNWTSRYDKIKGLKVSATATQKSGAVKYAELQLGDPYGFTTRNDTSTWYCSKLVWAAYKGQGIDLEPHTAMLITPGDILSSPYVSVFYNTAD